MAKYVEDVINIAVKEIGYLEKKSNNSLDDKTENAGSANWTKYGRDMCKITGIYGTHAAWCDCFVDWCFVQAYGREEAEKMLGGFSAYTPTSAGYFKNMGKWHTISPKAGDVIFFKNAQRICHTGIVYKVDETTVYTIEGNTSGGSAVIPNGGGVCAKAYSLLNGAIAGYGRPDYDERIEVSVPEKKEYYGVDISSYQGTVNGSILKTAVDFVILRSTVKGNGLDKQFEYNYKQCIQNNIPVGVYKFSYALNVQDAIEEAKSVINALQGKKITCGVWLDLEWNQQGALGKAAITQIARAFITTMEAAGYKCGIYSNLNWYRNILDPNSLQYPYWIARYPSQDNGTVKENLRPTVGVMWQYSSKGKVPGINVQAVDMNVAYVDLEELFKGSANTQPTPPPQSTVKDFTIKNTVTASALNVRKGVGTSYGIIKSIKRGTEVTVIEVSNDWYNIGSGWVSGKYIASTQATVTASVLNIRSTYSTAGKILGTYKKGTVVNILARHGDWYLTTKGWVSGKYLI